MIHVPLALMILVILKTPANGSETLYGSRTKSQVESPIKVIDIFTDFPSTDDIIKEYHKIRAKRLESDIRNRTDHGRSLSRRAYTDYYDDFYDRRSGEVDSDRYHYDEDKYEYARPVSNKYDALRDKYDAQNYDKYEVDKYGSGQKYYDHKTGDVLESEFGVFDRPLSEDVVQPDETKYVYLQGQKYVDKANIYTIHKQHSNEDNTNNFQDKLNKFVIDFGVRPNFETRRNLTSNHHVYFIAPTTVVKKHDKYVDRLTFDADDKDIVHNMNSLNEFFDHATTEKSNRFSGMYIEGVSGLNKLNKNVQNATKTKVTNIIRKHLVKMHKKQSDNNSKRHKNNRSKHKDRTLNFVQEDTKSEYDLDYKLHEGQGKFLVHPLEAIKNKTLKFANKFLSLFTVIQFDNFKCQATSSISAYEGICYLPSECAQMAGIAMGNCADGHGVCCVFKGSCGDSGYQNCTYFESPGYPNYFPGDTGTVPPGQISTSTTPNPLTPDPRLQFYIRQGRATDMELANALSCIFKVYKFSDDIKQIRIDFVDLELKGPVNGVCTDERLVISGTNLNTLVPIICGYNTGQHIYVDVSSLTGPLQIAVLANSIERKRYKLKICQYSDGCSGLMNCLQYYTGVTGTITSFNYEQAASFSRSTPQYLNNLNYAICIRREPGYCTITYTNRLLGIDYPFELKNYEEDGMLTVPRGQAGVGVINCPDDYLVINGIRLCGDRLNDGSVNADFSTNAPVTDYSGGPIIIPVRTSSASNGRGFKLFYTQNLCGSTATGGGTSGGGVPDPRLRRRKNYQ